MVKNVSQKKSDWNHERRLLKRVFVPLECRSYIKYKMVLFSLNLGAYTSHTVDRFTFIAVCEWHEKKQNHLQRI